MQKSLPVEGERDYWMLKRIYEAFARIEFDSLFLGDLDGFSGFGISSFPCFSNFDIETSKSRKSHSFSLFQRSSNPSDQGSECFLCLNPSDPGIF